MTRFLGSILIYSLYLMSIDLGAHILLTFQDAVRLCSCSIASTTVVLVHVEALVKPFEEQIN